MTPEMILFLDIETAQSPQNFYDLPEDGKYAFRKRFKEQIDDESTETAQHVWQSNAPLYAEYAIIVCISLGYVHEGKLRIRTLSGTEKEMLEELAMVCGHFDFLCGHNSMEFDFAFITRKFFMHRITPPKILNNFGKKPWEMALLDTCNIWKASSYKYYASLAQIAFALGLPTPKDDMQGHEVPQAYYKGRLPEIITYCEKDVVTLVNIFRIMRNDKVFEPSQIEHINYQPATI
jgi:predicted PolB exonuclease-like 3'-5' exonuclease